MKSYRSNRDECIKDENWCRDPKQCIDDIDAARAVKEIQMAPSEGIGQKIDRILKEGVSEKVKEILDEIQKEDCRLIYINAASLHQYFNVSPEFWEF